MVCLKEKIFLKTPNNKDFWSPLVKFTRVIPCYILLNGHLDSILSEHVIAVKYVSA